MKKYKSSLFISIILLISFLLAGCAQPPAPDSRLIQTQTRKPVIFDTDMAHEDMISALFLLSHPNVDLKAITVTGTGEAHCAPGVVNALGLVKVSGHEEIPVTCGRETPLVGNHEFPEEWRQGADNAYGVNIPQGGEPSELNAVDLIIDIVQNSDEPVTIVAVGPLTNIADAIQKAPSITSNIDTIFIMGGAVNVDGNVGNSSVGINNQHAEWNIYIDPTAANIVFESGVPITLIPLDATRDVPVTRKFYTALEEYLNTPSANLVHDILTANLDFVDSGGFQFWDTLTSAVFTDESLADFEEMNLSVVEEEDPDSGYTKPDSNGSMIRVTTNADQKKFESLLLTILNWEIK